MEFKEFVKEYNRMCAFYRNCIDCPIDKEADNRGLSELKCSCCVVDFLLDIDAESIVEKWAKEHPVKTYKTDFEEKMKELLKIFPNHEVDKIIMNPDKDIYKNLCVADYYFGGEAKKAGCRNVDCSCATCKDCWNREINEHE